MPRVANTLWTADDGSYDTGWVPVAISPGFQAQGSDLPRVRRIGKVVYIRWGWNNTGMSANSAYDVGVLPEGFRPSQTTYISLATNDPDYPARASLWQNGTVNISTGATLASYFLFDGHSYLVD